MCTGSTFKALVTALCLLLVLAAGTPTAAKETEASKKVHAALRKLAREQPDRTVPVIVQMRREGALGKSNVAKGARKLRDFPFISAHIVELPAQAAMVLAAHPDVKFLSPDVPLRLATFDTIKTVYQAALGVTDTFWTCCAAGEGQGAGVGVAVLDSGVADHPDLVGRLHHVSLPDMPLGTADENGHGTHVAGIIAGKNALGTFAGVAPRATVYNIRTANAEGQSREGDLIKGLEWIYYNHRQHNIRVVNISAQSTIAQSYQSSALAAAVEALWFEGIVVVVSAGNNGAVPDAMHYAPSNDPFVITVGALSDQATANRSDDVVMDWSSRGLTQEGYAKPEVLAPGHRIVAPLAPGSRLAQELPDRVVNGTYISLSGTSMAAPVIAGLAANLLSYRPDLTPDQVKWLIQNFTYGATTPGAADARAIWTYLQDHPTSQIPAANQGLVPNAKADGSGSSDPFDDNVFWENVFWENAFWENIRTQ